MFISVSQSSNPQSKNKKTKHTTTNKKPFLFNHGIYRRNLPADDGKMEWECRSSDSIIHIFPTVTDLLVYERISFTLKEQWAQV